jgi:hypothetical protein
MASTRSQQRFQPGRLPISITRTTSLNASFPGSSSPSAFGALASSSL